MKGYKSHPYIPNSVLEVQKEMLKEIGLNSLEELHAEIPDEIKLKEGINLPKPFQSEYELKRHVEGILSKNKTCKENLNFLGAGCFQHYVPALCDEINSRGEFLTAYGGEPYNDFGRFQALFEYQSLVAELVDMDVVNVPTMDGAQAAATAVRMAARITQRDEVLVPKAMDYEKFLIMKNYCAPDLTLIQVAYNKENGQLDLEDLRKKVSEKTAAIFFENPSFLGFIEENGQEISNIAHDAGALSVVGVDPSSLGVLAPPSQYGADIISGDLQPLGIHMNYGGGQSGFIATRDEEKFVMEFPSRLFGIAPTCVEGEYGFGDVAYDRTSFGHHRHEGKEYVGTQTALWGITAGVYLATMGPKGMYELGKTIMQKSQYAVKRLSEIKGVKGSLFTGVNFKEFVVDFNETGKRVKEINRLLIEKGIFGGKDLSKDFPELGESALYCVTEVHTKEDIDKLVVAIQECVKA
ncbi:aminomethyl-transferring glycine dehydrogenase subunit GcvPA [Crassaminicella thermophila]|uniref:Aminomethyl-transferring glycine dehydrogenase subunit GcvPA n=1 Tax=Crassaminicella thermophila TaxID=2599308 RepID=A0A5C0SG96_CRATE|nr:aminomethyl-transferring glycine dehydrogenase subunit GcvPA [Crassaminicella thermophila]QEK13595.1 aminomethyl-transferring glycine dehydrogenase subunit GcvPA [Crassaminicella thermophila]